jgi:glycosyltransferase involved in cell wall biosynthesis
MFFFNPFNPLICWESFNLLGKNTIIEPMLTSPKICLITNRYPTHPDDVASPFVRDFHLGLKERDIDVSIFTPYYQTEKVEWSEDVVRFNWRGGEKVIGSLNFFNPKEFLDLLSFLKGGKRQLFEHLRRTNPDHCLALWALPSGWFAYQAKKKLGIPYSVWCLGSDIYVWAKKPILRGIIKKVLQEADHLFADGFDLKERVEKLSGKRCHFLPSMRRLPKVTGEETNLDQAKFNFLYVGRWEKKKGLDGLINAFALVKTKIPSVNLYILGWGYFEKKMKNLVKRLNLADEIKIVGRVSTSSVANYIKQADCAVIPSKGDSIPLIFSEALQMGTPLIVTDVGDMGYLARKFNLGKVVPKGDSPKLAQAMIEFASEKSEGSIGKNYSENIPEVLKMLSIEKAVEDYLRTVTLKPRCETSTILTLSH